MERVAAKQTPHGHRSAAAEAVSRRSPPGRRSSRSARSGTPAAEGARETACRDRAARARSAPPPDGSPAGQPRERSGHGRAVVLEKLGERGGGGRRPRVDDQSRGRSGSSGRVRRKISRSRRRTRFRVTAFPTRRGTEIPRRGRRAPGRIREKKDLDVASGNAHPGGVALFEFPAFAEAVVFREGLGDGRARVHTESFLRPLRRRAESTARPARVRIRTRKPCVRLRRRLLGW